jgi:lysophospholipase L1-like esterase
MFKKTIITVSGIITAFLLFFACTSEDIFSPEKVSPHSANEIVYSDGNIISSSASENTKKTLYFFDFDNSSPAEGAFPPGWELVNATYEKAEYAGSSGKAAKISSKWGSYYSLNMNYINGGSVNDLYIKFDYNLAGQVSSRNLAVKGTPTPPDAHIRLNDYSTLTYQGTLDIKLENFISGQNYGIKLNGHNAASAGEHFFIDNVEIYSLQPKEEIPPENILYSFDFDTTTPTAGQLPPGWELENAVYEIASYPGSTGSAAKISSKWGSYYNVSMNYINGSSAGDLYIKFDYNLSGQTSSQNLAVKGTATPPTGHVRINGYEALPLQGTIDIKLDNFLSGEDYGIKLNGHDAAAAGEHFFIDNLIIYTKDLIGEPPVGTKLISASHTAFQYFGRYDFRNANAPASTWPGTYIKVRFSGTSLSVILNDSANKHKVFIDNVEYLEIQGGAGDSEILISDSLSDTVHDLVIFKRTEKPFNKSIFKGIKIDGNASVLPPALHNRRIEFVGDSWTVGYGVLSPSRTCDANQLFQYTDNWYSWVQLTARELQAETSVVARSGIGVYKNASGSTSGQMPDQYPRTLFNNGSLTWDNSLYVPDVVVLFLSINDANGGSTAAQYKNAYTEMIELIRSKNPGTTIICLAHPNHNYDNVHAVVDAQKQSGHNDIHVINVPSCSTTGCHWHPSKTGHEQLKAGLSPQIKSIMNW